VIFDAVADQVVHFEGLWDEFLWDQKKKGGYIVPSERSMSFFVHLFRAYTEGYQEGIVLFAGDFEAVLMWGLVDFPYDLTWGRTAQDWGTYVQPAAQGRGISKAIRDAAKERAIFRKFEAVIASALTTNPKSYDIGTKYGFEPYEVAGVLKLEAE
jgi:GNAT superfamily N-acetyltransferase